MKTLSTYSSSKRNKRRNSFLKSFTMFEIVASLLAIVAIVITNCN